MWFGTQGFDALAYKEHIDYEAIASTNPDFNKAIVRVNIFKDHRQTIQYIEPHDSDKLAQAELVVIDEAAAIPLPLVKNLLVPCVVFMASTINGYEGTGRSLSLKLISQLRKQSATLTGGAIGGAGAIPGMPKLSVCPRLFRSFINLFVHFQLEMLNSTPPAVFFQSTRQWWRGRRPLADMNFYAAHTVWSNVTLWVCYPAFVL